MNQGAPQNPKETRVHFQMLRLYIESISNFSGNDYSTFEVFLELCKSLVRTYRTNLNPNDPLSSLF